MPLFHRYPGNPILHPGNVPFPARLVFNPGAALPEGDVSLKLYCGAADTVVRLAEASLSDVVGA